MSKILCFLGFMLMLGTVGGMETFVIPFGQGLIQLTIGLIIFLGAGYVGGLTR